MRLRVLNAFSASVGLALLASGGASFAQPWPPGPGQPPQPAQNYQSQICMRLEGQLQTIDRGGGDQARVEQARRYEEAANRQQSELDRMLAQSKRQGCEGGGFFIFGSGNANSPQCTELTQQISRMRTNLDRMNTDLQRLRGGDSDRGEQRRSVVLALAQNNCGAQYRTAARQQGGFLDQLFGRGGETEQSESTPGTEMANPAVQGGSLRTVCVRTCDGYYFPISYATNASRFAQDEKACQRLCPAAEVQLFSYPTEGGEIAQATSTSGTPYSSLPNAFKYRQSFDAACTCKKPGQSWADAVGKDDAVEPGDVVVTDDRSKQMAIPPAQKGQTKSRAPAATAAPAPPAAPPAKTAAPVEPPAADPPADGAKKPVRAVGPTFIPAR
jgi:hypothetical protein